MDPLAAALTEGDGAGAPDLDSLEAPGGWRELLAPGVLVVTGKGGTGKSTVAAALAMASVAAGNRTLLVEVEGRGEIARTLGIPDPGLRERHTGWGFNVLSITPREAVLEYLHRYAPMRRLPRTILRSRAIEQVVTSTPGFRDLLALGMLYEILVVRPGGSRKGREPLYDLAVVDGPPTGQVVSFLSAPATFTDLIRVGRMRHQAAGVAEMLATTGRVAMVCVPEEMAVAETLECIPEVRRVGIPVAGVVLNQARPAFGGGTEARARLRPGEAVSVAAEAGFPLERDQAVALLAGGRTAYRRRARQRTLTDVLERGAPVLTLPRLPGLSSRELATDLSAVIGGGTFTLPAPSGKARKHLPPVATTTLDAGLAGARIVVVCGSGGAGKTTTSAAIAVHLAESGRRTILLTIDPAHRLATALRLPLKAGQRVTIPLRPGRSMDAMQLDVKRTFDELIDRFAATPEQRDRILSNPVYERLSDTLAGTHEYMAMEKLYELARETDYEAIVVDTPPTRSALGFIDAPRRLTDFLGGRFLRWILWPSVQAGKAAVGLARFSARAFAQSVGRIVGAEVLADTAEFLAAFQGMYGGFKERAARVLELMASPDCTFVIVAAPTGASLEEAGFFLSRLAESEMPPAAMVVNRWTRHDWRLPVEAGEAATRLAAAGGAGRALSTVIADRLLEERGDEMARAAIAAFAFSHPDAPIVAVPDLDDEPQEVSGLRRMNEHLFAARASADRSAQ